MEISSLLIGTVLLVVSLVFISLPFRQRQPANLKRSKAEAQSESRREAIFSALRDLDFDFNTGKVGEEDYTPLRVQLLGEAAQYIEQEKREEEQLEALIQSRRANQKQSIRCDHCDAPMEAGQKFCSKCGSAVNEKSCPSCGQKIRSDDQFCSSCGNRLGVAVEAVAQS